MSLPQITEIERLIVNVEQKFSNDTIAIRNNNKQVQTYLSERLASS